MTETKEIERQVKPWTDWLVVLACIAPSLLVGLYGLNRAYDAIPDQDMLWASEALRLLRGVAPSYADHPGAFWTLTYKANILILKNIFDLPVLDFSGNILPGGLDLIIRVARVQNAILSGLCAALTYPLMLRLGAQRVLTVVASLIISLSTATLVSVSEIRSEQVSVLFLILFVIFIGNGASAKMHGSKGLGFASALTALCFFFAAALSKQQVLLSAPLAFIAVAASLDRNSPLAYKSTLAEVIRMPPRKIAGLLAIASFPWLIAAHPDIDLINLPVWAIINIGLAMCILPCVDIPCSKRPLLWSLGVVGVFEITLFKIVLPGWWRQAVTGFPSWMLRHANQTNDPAAHTLNGIDTYLSELFIPHELAAIALISLLLLSIIDAVRNGEAHDRAAAINRCGKALAWLLAVTVLIASSQRIASRYEVYFFIPIITVSALAAAEDLPTINQSRFSRLRSHTEKAFALAMLATAFSASMTNASDLSSFVNKAQPRSFVCFGHHMDKTMRLTTAAQCENFNDASLSKNEYDNWSGPN